MDRDSLIIGFEGLITCADHCIPFQRLTSKLGQQEEIDDIISLIDSFFINHQLISSNALVEKNIKAARKIVLFIVLNTNLPAVEAMCELQNLEAIVMTLYSVLPKLLMSEIFWRLPLKKFVYETIAYMDPNLSLEIATEFIESIKFFTPLDCLEKVKIILSAIYRMVCRYHLFEYCEDESKEKCDLALASFENCLKFFTEPPKLHILESLTDDELYEYKGTCIYTMLLLIKDCFQYFTGQEKHNCLNDDIYTCTYWSEVKIDLIPFKICDSPNEVIIKYLHKLNFLLLNTFQELVMDVTIDMFCGWSEIEDNGISMQRKIGETCYKLTKDLHNISSVSEHPIFEMCSHICVEPPNVQDLILKSDITTMAYQIMSGCEDHHLWLQSLINRDEIYENEIALKCISTHLQLIDSNECYNLYKRLRSYIQNNAMTSPSLETFAVTVFNSCTIDAKYEILHERFKANIFVDMVIAENITEQLIEVFNKFASQDEDLTNILGYFLQSPAKVIHKIFDSSITSSHMLTIMVKLMKVLQNFIDHYYRNDVESCVLKTIKMCMACLDDNAKLDNFIKFINYLKQDSLISGKQLLLYSILPSIDSAISENNKENIKIQCMLLRSAYKVEELIEYRAPLLAMYAQILEELRWNINTYYSNAPIILQVALDLQKELFQTYSPEIPSTEEIWLNHKLHGICKQNLYYYQKELLTGTPFNLLDFITRQVFQVNIDRPNIDRVLFMMDVSVIIATSTVEEWFKIWDDLIPFSHEQKLGIFHTAIIVIIETEYINRTETTWPSILYYYRCFIFLVMKKYLHRPLQKSQVEKVIDMFPLLLNKGKEDDYENIRLSIMPFIMFLAEYRSEYSFDAHAYIMRRLRTSKYLSIFTEPFEALNKAM